MVEYISRGLPWVKGGRGCRVGSGRQRLDGAWGTREQRSWQPDPITRGGEAGSL